MYVLTNISPSISARPIYDLVNRTKPQLNRNVIAAVKNVANIDMCMRYGGVIMMDIWQQKKETTDDFHDDDDGNH